MALPTLLRPYCTLEGVQALTGSTQPEHDAKFLNSINAASRMVEDICGRWFWFHDHAEEGYTVPRSYVAGTVAMLPFEIITLTEVTLDSEPVELTEIVFDVGGRALFKSSDWSAGEPFRSALVIKGTFGYPLAVADDTTLNEVPPPTIPYRVTRATEQIAASLSGEWRKEHTTFSGDKTVFTESRIPPEARELLRPYILKGRAVGM